MGQGQLVELSPGSSVRYIEDFIERDAADALLAELVHDIPWDTNVTGAFARPRRTYWIGDFAYAYSGVEHAPSPWTAALDRLRIAVETAVFGDSAGQYRGLLLNHYRNGNDSIGFHADNEAVIEPESPIASLSLGAPRTFVLQPKRKRIAPADHRIQLAHGSCLIMRGRTQLDWRHGIPAEPEVTGDRVNLTFRKYASYCA